MKKKPIVAIVGRPNVGKSTLFNYIAGARISIVEDVPGVTRDRIYADAEWVGREFTMIDTGGIDTSSGDVLLSEMRDQAEIAIDTADVIIFLCDGKHSYTAEDENVADILRRSGKQVILALNKIDTYRKPPHFYDYYDLGFGEPFMISSVNKMGVGDLLDEVVAGFPDARSLDDEDDVIRISLIGKPNSGKSSLVNRIIGEKRVIVSNIPGTTRDAVDTFFRRDGQDFALIDTAGIRRKSKVNENIERYSVLRAMTAIERSDVCLIVIDASEGITDQDKKVAGLAHDAGKASIFVVNKWDLLEKDNRTHTEFVNSIRREFVFMQYAPCIFVSALTGQRIGEIVKLVTAVYENSVRRISTGVVNEVINEAIVMHQVPSDKGKRLKIFYASQVDVRPPTFLFSVNDIELMHFSYLRYLENCIRKNFEFEGTPIVMKVKARGGDK